MVITALTLFRSLLLTLLLNEVSAVLMSHSGLALMKLLNIYGNK